MTVPTRLVAALSSLLLLASLVGAPATLAVGSTPVVGPPTAIRGASAMWGQTSTFYAGYSAHLRSGSFSRVTGTWVVPRATCDGTTSVMFAWVGMDDGGKKYLEQAGTGDYCLAGSRTPQYYAWYEMFPKPSVPATLVVRPGDTIRTTVSASGSRFTFRIENLTTHKTFVKAASQTRALRVAAYWIVESPWAGSAASSIYPLTRFARFTLLKASARADGRTGSIGSRLWDARVLWTMAKGRTNKASAGGLTHNGSSFRVTWHHR